MRLTDAAFEGAVERYGDTVFRLAYSYLKNRADAGSLAGDAAEALSGAKALPVAGA